MTISTTAKTNNSTFTTTFTKHIIAALLGIIMLFSGGVLSFAEEPAGNNATNEPVDYEAAYHALLEIVQPKIPDFTLDANHVLSASTPYNINVFTKNISGVYNPTTQRYEINLVETYNLYVGAQLTNANTLYTFTWNGITFSFPINCSSTEWGYIDKNFSLSGMGVDEVMQNFTTPVLLGFYESNDNTMGQTSPGINLVTESGVINTFIFIRLNSVYIQNGFNMKNTLCHELGHAIVLDIILRENGGTLTGTTLFLWNNNIFVSKLLCEVIDNNFGGNYSIITNSISNYAASNLAEIPSESIAQYIIDKNSCSEFNRVFAETLIKKWVMK